MSPRISFSHDLQTQPDVDVLLADHRRQDDSAADFRFDVRRGMEDETSTADELFSGGKILPFLPRSNSKDASFAKPPGLPPVPPPAPAPRKESLREIMAAEEPAAATGASSKSSFWRFKRSSSLNSGSGIKRGLLHKLPLLHRSNSTGSVGQESKRKTTTPPSSQSQPRPVASMPATAKKRETAVRPGGYGNGGVRINPVLNVPPPYISSGTTNLFGFGYFFRPARDAHRPKKR